MADIDANSSRGRSMEDHHFAKAEAELLEKVRARAAKEQERRALGHYHGVEDPEILRAFEEAGFDHHTVQILHLVPLLQVAWVDGEISGAERKELLAIAAARDVAAGSPAHAKLLSWLQAPPSADFFERSMHLIASLIEAFPDPNRSGLHADVMNTALAVASASGGFLGMGSKVSSQEQALLAKFNEAFEKAHQSALEKVAKKG